MKLAFNTDKGIALVEALIEEMRRTKIIIPAMSTVERLAWEARRRAQNQFYLSLTKRLTTIQKKELDGLLVINVEKNRTPLVWLRQPPGVANPKNFLKILDKFEFIRDLNLDSSCLAKVHHNRLVQLTRIGVKTTPAHIARLDELRRYATLVDFLLVSERKIFPMKINRFGKAEILNPQEITLLFSEGLVKPRDRALFGVCLYAAARINESCTLQRGDIIGTRRRYSVADTRGNSRDRTPPVSGRIILPFGTLMLLIVSGSILLTMSQILAG